MKSQNNKQTVVRRSTFAILFYINRTKVRKDGLCQLLCKVSIDAEAAQIGTKVAVDPAIWNPTTGRADRNSQPHDGTPETDDHPNLCPRNRQKGGRGYEATATIVRQPKT